MQRHTVAASVVVSFLLAVFLSQPQSPAAEDDFAKSVDTQIDQVYAAIVQVASTDYNLKSAEKDAHTVTFFTGGTNSLIGIATCHAVGQAQTAVTLSVEESVGNPWLWLPKGEKKKFARAFWQRLDATLRLNQNLGPTSSSGNPAGATDADFSTVEVKSDPDGADIYVDGKFSGSTPSKLRILAGDHTLRASMSGFNDWEKTITLTPGAAVTVRAVLDRKK